MIDCEKCMYRKNGGCGYDKNGCGFVPKTGDLISREYLLSLASAEGAYDYVSAEEIAKAPAVPAIPIPDNATNGDVIKALFPRIKTKKFTTFLRVIEGEEYIPMTYDWWNAPYKRGETNE